jgi:hypothetical protein
MTARLEKAAKTVRRSIDSSHNNQGRKVTEAARFAARALYGQDKHQILFPLDPASHILENLVKHNPNFVPHCTLWSQFGQLCQTYDPNFVSSRTSWSNFGCLNLTLSKFHPPWRPTKKNRKNPPKMCADDETSASLDQMRQTAHLVIMTLHQTQHDA